ncbi:MAG: NAD-dependent protein deacetylase [Polyangiaceae bacterium]|jgi:NAD-dependent SIR2 family protein deacetylase
MQAPASNYPIEIERLAALLRQRRCLVLTGAGCSTESGIPDYRGEGRPRPSRKPIQHDAFIGQTEVRRRYWARSVLGWPRIVGAEPNLAHRALAAMESAGAVLGILTQNVDRLHHRAGSSRVVELHGALADVSCLDCGAYERRADVQRRLLDENPGWLEHAAAFAPDGDSELEAAEVEAFRVVSCRVCGGIIKPDVVFFGGSVPRRVVAEARGMFDEAEALVIVGSSLTLFSGFRFVRDARESGRPVAIVNLGPTRADEGPLHTRLFARAGMVLPRLAELVGA